MLCLMLSLHIKPRGLLKQRVDLILEPVRVKLASLPSNPTSALATLQCVHVL
jgi:hypothetical protein